MPNFSPEAADALGLADFPDSSAAWQLLCGSVFSYLVAMGDLYRDLFGFDLGSLAQRNLQNTVGIGGTHGVWVDRFGQGDRASKGAVSAFASQEDCNAQPSATQVKRMAGRLAREFRLLRYFAQNPGTTLSREVLLKEVWGYSEETFTRTVDVHVGSLRQKLEKDPKQPAMIVTVPGLGYKFVA